MWFVSGVALPSNRSYNMAHLKQTKAAWPNLQPKTWREAAERMKTEANGVRTRVRQQTPASRYAATYSHRARTCGVPLALSLSSGQAFFSPPPIRRQRNHWDFSPATWKFRSRSNIARDICHRADNDTMTRQKAGMARRKARCCSGRKNAQGDGKGVGATRTWRDDRCNRHASWSKSWRRNATVVLRRWRTST